MRSRLPFIGPALIALLLVCPLWAHAQAFTPPKGEGSVSVMAQDTLVRHHFNGSTEVDRGHIRLQAVMVDMNYGVTDKLALGVAVPWIHAKYYGSFPHPAAAGTPLLDNGSYHSAYQDIRFDVRYNLTKDRIVLTPYAAVIVPTHDYVFLAHSAIGRQLHEVQVGAYVARLLDPILPGAFVQARYGYGIPQSTLGIRPLRSNLDLEVGYFVNPSLRVFAMGMGQITYAGIDAPAPGAPVLTNPLFVHHDQISRENAFKAGAGAAFSINDRIDVFASAIKTLTGRNGHAFAYNLNAGVTVSFGKRGGSAKAAPSAADAAATGLCHDETDTKEAALSKCVCIKGS